MTDWPETYAGVESKSPDPGPALLALPPSLSREQQHRAALTVAHHCTDVDDCRELLDALGLREELRA